MKRRIVPGNHSHPEAPQIRLLVLDIDGTIAGESNDIADPVLEAIQAAQARGIQVAIATGRMYRSALRFHQKIQSTLPLIAYQGAWIQDPHTQEYHRHTPVGRPQAEQLIRFLDQRQFRDQLSIHFYIDDQLYVRKITPVTAAYAERSGVEPIEVGDLRTVLDRPTTKVLALSDDPEPVQRAMNGLKMIFSYLDLHITTSTPTFIEATHPLANKGDAVQYLAEGLLGLYPEEVMTIGDNCNDAEMLLYSGFSVAMANSPDSVQQVADWIAPSVEEHGAAIAIHKFLL